MLLAVNSFASSVFSYQMQKVALKRQGQLNAEADDSI
jgi:hypothetical protein